MSLAVLRDVCVDALEVAEENFANGDGCEDLLTGCLIVWLRAEDLEDKQAGSDNNCRVGEVEVGPMVGTDVYINEVDDVVVDNAIVKVADGTAEDKSERDAGLRKARTGAHQHDADDDDCSYREEDEALENLARHYRRES